MKTTTVEVPAPPFEGALLVATTEMRLTLQQAEDIKKRLEAVTARMRAAIQTGEWPVVVVVDSGLKLEWIAQPGEPNNLDILRRNVARNLRGVLADSRGKV